MKSRLKRLLEELGVAAAEPVHTAEQPKEHTPEVKEEEVHAGEQKAEEIEAPIIESYTLPELHEAFTAAGLDTNKYTTEYLAEQLGFEPLNEYDANKKMMWHAVDNPFQVASPEIVDKSTINYKGEGKDAQLMARTKDGKEVRWLDPQFSTKDVKAAKDKKEKEKVGTVRESFGEWSKKRTLNEFNPYLQKKMYIDSVGMQDLKAIKDPNVRTAQILSSLNKGKRKIDPSMYSADQLSKLGGLLSYGYSDRGNNYEIKVEPSGAAFDDVHLVKKGLGGMFSKPAMSVKLAPGSNIPGGERRLDNLVTGSGIEKPSGGGPKPPSPDKPKPVTGKGWGSL
jgi:hypothetical protein